MNIYFLSHDIRHILYLVVSYEDIPFKSIILVNTIVTYFYI